MGVPDGSQQERDGRLTLQDQVGFTRICITVQWGREGLASSWVTAGPPEGRAWVPVRQELERLWLPRTLQYEFGWVPAAAAQGSE